MLARILKKNILSGQPLEYDLLKTPNCDEYSEFLRIRLSVIWPSVYCHSG